MPALCRLRRHAPKTLHHPVPLRVGASALADCHSSTAAAGTPRKSMNTRVTTSGVGETRIGGAFSYDSCERKRSATYSCFSKSGSQYLRVS